MRSILFGAAADGGLQLTWADNQSKPEGRRRDWGKSQAAIGKCGRERNPKKKGCGSVSKMGGNGRPMKWLWGQFHECGFDLQRLVARILTAWPRDGRGRLANRALGLWPAVPFFTFVSFDFFCGCFWCRRCCCLIWWLQLWRHLHFALERNEHPAPLVPQR